MIRFFVFPGRGRVFHLLSAYPNPTHPTCHTLNTIPNQTISSHLTPVPPSQVKEICTRGPKMVAAKRSDTIEACVKKMIAADVRHLPVIDDDTGEVFGLISVKASQEIERHERVTSVLDRSAPAGHGRH